MFNRFKTKLSRNLVIGSSTIVVTTSTYLLTRGSNNDNINLPQDPASLYYGSKLLRTESQPKPVGSDTDRLSSTWTPPTRAEMLKQFRSNEEYDLLIVGGGATGAGIAVDAASRGLRVGLVERDDFSSGK